MIENCLGVIPKLTPQKAHFHFFNSIVWKNSGKFFSIASASRNQSFECSLSPYYRIRMGIFSDFLKLYTLSSKFAGAAWRTVEWKMASSAFSSVSCFLKVWTCGAFCLMTQKMLGLLLSYRRFWSVKVTERVPFGSSSFLCSSSKTQLEEERVFVSMVASGTVWKFQKCELREAFLCSLL